MLNVREDEPKYAKLFDPKTEEQNRYGKEIKLTPVDDNGISLRINGDDGIGPNPNRTKQHAFHFTADNCIGCHACEAACSEKNDLPPHLSYRSVGYVEGGTFPNFTRMNISMACNHCDDPVCLKGCPTRAYTKHPEYGAVIQDPDICFGCGYCTWVCPYNAPQLDPVNGQVEKCNMCVDRLEVGLKPACVSACLGNALNFGVVENTPQNRDQIETQIPGFPDPSITKPNIRFQQIKDMPREVTRTDSMPVKYHKNNKDGKYKPVVDQKEGVTKQWNLKRLSSRENPLVLFTLVTQASIGLFAIAFLGGLLGVPALSAAMNSVMYVPMVAIAFGLAGLGLFLSTTHLGKPFRFYRGFNNLRHSPVSREGAGVAVYMAFAGLHLLTMLPNNAIFQGLFGDSLAAYTAVPATVTGALAFLGSLVGLYYMYRCYRIPARPFWNHRQTASTFGGTALALGGLVYGVLNVPYLAIIGDDYTALLSSLAVVIVAGLAVEGVGLKRHAKDLNKAENEGAVSHYVQSTTFGKSYLLRNVLIAINIVAVLALGAAAINGWLGLTLWGLVTVSVLGSALIGRAIFYVLVVPTTMPGAFFWKNKAFEEHAREIGLAANPAVGVATWKH
ncbi:DmsC/YnfH family molybdoenzyme membrane anchor subunit [Teredinibacter franksiae]|uniref:DmsC/YnfH family molybdoenzyme membrane anchor subunit n=1 Tax=Teredinibacter franksiae TaxID=2761453 RepID=UPI0016292F5B|nr:DmsC/YnfH family molybdoenzyme membrane anchor subunit [Teredinibacter franksiae]